MSRISILPDALADKIAAGEVVQRPASVVKELIENSIDAGAGSIGVAVRQAGKLLMAVSDNGSGMDRADAELSVRRHATSKISTAEDLHSIRSLGFRGEALAAIGSVSRMEIRTRSRDSEIGTLVTSEAGKVTEVVPVAAPAGTTVSVKNLFYNVPGRRKFLKSDSTEFRHIADAFQRLAVARPDIAFSLSHDDEAISSFTAASSAKRVAQVFGEEEAGRLLPIEGSAGGLSVAGFVSTPAYARRGRAEQFLILNGRPVSNRSLAHAVFSGYERLLEKGSFPLSVVFLTIDPSAVDVNVHPQKLEVKFVDESAAYRAVHGAVRRALSDHVLVANVGLRKLTSHGDETARLFASVALPKSAVRETLFGAGLSVDVEYGQVAGATLPTESLNAAGTTQLAEGAEGKTRYLQIHDKYIVARSEDGVVIVDQHAAHERVLYERAVKRFENGAGPSQDLLFPIVLNLSPADAALAAELAPLLGPLGFRLRPFGSNSYMLDGVPVDLPPGGETAIVEEILAHFREDQHRTKLEPRERLARSYSCRAAIKAGQKLGGPEMKRLLEDLLATSVPSVCPHGRPVLIKLTLSELDRRFGRSS